MPSFETMNNEEQIRRHSKEQGDISVSAIRYHHPPLGALSPAIDSCSSEHHSQKLSSSSGSLRGAKKHTNDEHQVQALFSFSSHAKEDALAAIHHKMPQKIYEIEKLMQKCSLFNECTSQELSISSTFLLLNREKQEFNSKWISKMETDPVKTFTKHSTEISSDIRTWICKLRSEIIEFIQILDSIKLYIELNIPRIEDGNNFGVSVQEDMIQELVRVEEGALQILDDISKYYTGRAKLVSKVQKHPEIDDYKIALTEIDMKQIFQLKMNFVGTRNGYAVLSDMLQKNLERIVKPRSTTSYAGSMY